MDDLYKIVGGFLTMVLGWCYCAVQRNATKHEKHDERINALELSRAIDHEQSKQMLMSLEEVKQLGVDIKASNVLILQALARKAK